jgi:hypothetical protein
VALMPVTSCDFTHLNACLAGLLGFCLGLGVTLYIGHGCQMPDARCHGFSEGMGM